MKQLTFTAEEQDDGKIISEMDGSEFSMMEIMGILTNQVILLSEKARGQVPIKKIQSGSSLGSTH